MPDNSNAWASGVAKLVRYADSGFHPHLQLAKYSSAMIVFLSLITNIPPTIGEDRRPRCLRMCVVKNARNRRRVFDGRK